MVRDIEILTMVVRERIQAGTFLAEAIQKQNTHRLCG